MQLQYPEPVQIIERYDPDFANEEEFLTEEQRQLRREKSEKYKKMLAAHRYVPDCSDSLCKVVDSLVQGLRHAYRGTEVAIVGLLLASAHPRGWYDSSSFKTELLLVV